MIISESKRTLLTRFFIASTLAIIVGIYYFSERKPFEYQGYDKNVNLLQRYNAELNEAIVKTRFGILENYDPIDSALNGLQSVLNSFNQELKQSPNATLQNKLTALQDTLKLKEELTYKFKRLNPVLLNAINQFSTILAELIESQSSTAAAEAALSQDINFQITQDIRNEIIQKMNDLLRRTLTYINMPDASVHQQLLAFINEIEKLATETQANISKYPDLDIDFKKLSLSLVYAKKILELQPQISDIDQRLFEVPVVGNLNALNNAYVSIAQQHQKRAATYRIILYVLIVFLIIVLRWAFIQLRGMVNQLNSEIQQKIKAEKELEEINRQLEQRVAERTRELTVKNNDLNQAMADLKEAQEQLIIQEKMASVGMLTTGIAHEIKNPLNFVNNFSDISIDLVTDLDKELQSSKDKIDKEALDNIEDIISDLKTNCSKIKEHGVRADNIVKTMLLHSQESGVQKEMIDVRMLMNENIQIALESFKAGHDHFELIINKHFDPQLDNLLAAPQAIGRVFIYILDNAFYAMREKQKTAQQDYQPTLDITLQQLGSILSIKIKDNGIGIPKKSLDKVFQPFFTTKPTGKGNTGLGLSICYDTVVKQHKGELRVQSEENVYTEFTINLPIGTKTVEES